jgi:hypothetical protein
VSSVATAPSPALQSSSQSLVAESLLDTTCDPPEHEELKMKNVEMKLDGDILTTKVDLSKEFGLSSSGKSVNIASTEGNQSVEGREEVKIGLNIYKKPKRDQVTLQGAGLWEGQRSASDERPRFRRRKVGSSTDTSIKLSIQQKMGVRWTLQARSGWFSWSHFKNLSLFSSHTNVTTPAINVTTHAKNREFFTEKRINARS